jgi:GWxTD domain-containing protein
MGQRRAFVIAFAVTILCISALPQDTSRVPIGPEYRRWLAEDVRWIIQGEERESFLRLTSDRDRDQFVTNFWERRNPSPGSQENTFKNEHYRRLVFSNEHFAARLAGWRTDRGRIYTVYGPPDSIVTHASTPTKPVDEIWLYCHLKGQENVSLKFVDTCRCGDYRLQTELPSNE